MLKPVVYLIVFFIVLIIALLFCVCEIYKYNKVLITLTNRLKEECQQQNDRIRSLGKKIDQYQYFNTSLRLFDFSRAVGILENTAGDIYIALEKFHNDVLTFYFSGEKHKGVINCPVLFATVKSDYIRIDEIAAIDEDYGNGSLLLKCLLNKAKELKIKVIQGKLSEAYCDHFDKLEHFYKKNGFEVYFNDEHSEGEIIKKL